MHAEKVKETAKAKSEERTTKKAVRQMKDKLEKTTLGDLDAENPCSMSLLTTPDASSSARPRSALDVAANAL